MHGTDAVDKSVNMVMSRHTIVAPRGERVFFGALPQGSQILVLLHPIAPHMLHAEDVVVQLTVIAEEGAPITDQVFAIYCEDEVIGTNGSEEYLGELYRGNHLFRIKHPYYPDGKHILEPIDESANAVQEVREDECSTKQH